MAAHDDKISNKRRKLFKALSAAPVVATLRPGEALAGSTLQCLNKETGTVSTKIHLEPNVDPAGNCTTLASGGNGCFGYLPKDYWEPLDVAQTTVLNEFPITQIVADVNVDPSQDPVLMLMDHDGLNAVILVAGSGAGQYSLDTGNKQLTLFGTIGSGSTPGQITLDYKTGLFLAIGGPDDENNPTDFEVMAVYPRLDENGTTQSKLAGSCMTSFVQASSSGVVLNNG